MENLLKIDMCYFKMLKIYKKNNFILKQVIIFEHSYIYKIQQIKTLCFKNL